MYAHAGSKMTGVDGFVVVITLALALVQFHVIVFITAPAAIAAGHPSWNIFKCAKCFKVDTIWLQGAR